MNSKKAKALRKEIKAQSNNKIINKDLYKQLKKVVKENNIKR